VQLARRTFTRSARQGCSPIRAAEFTQLMDRLGPFEAAPRLVVGVSGGRDSMALALLAQEWTNARGGEVLAVTVDHGLRPASSAEADRVARWMRARGIAHHIARWDSPEGARGVEAAARRARYELLERFCLQHGILHLLIGHHQTDQDETRRMRRARGSGPVGRAGMAAIRETRWMRMLRPLLSVPRERITATLQACGQDWIEDPSNQDLRFERARLRLEPGHEVETEDHQEPAHLRVMHERAVATCAARAVGIHPAGFAVIDLCALHQGGAGVSRTLLGNVVTCVSGGIYPPRGARLDGLLANLTRESMDHPQTLAGCIIRPVARAHIGVFRELSGVVAPVSRPCGTLEWDGRFVVVLDEETEQGCVLDAAGHADQAQIIDLSNTLGLSRDVCATLPALFRDNEIVAYPSCRRVVDPAGAGLRNFYVRFAPQKPVSGAVFGNVSF